MQCVQLGPFPSVEVLELVGLCSGVFIQLVHSVELLQLVRRSGRAVDLNVIAGGAPHFVVGWRWRPQRQRIPTSDVFASFQTVFLLCHRILHQFRTSPKGEAAGSALGNAASWRHVP